MANTLENQQWDRGFTDKSALFEPLRSVSNCFREHSDWPDHADLNRQFQACDLPIRAVAQDGKPQCFEDHYEPRIYLRGELQTRQRNWHDFLNALVWLRFPRCKTILNQLHYQAASQRELKTNRSPFENLLTRFDESGAVLISSRPELLELVREHAWQELFWEQRERFGRDLRCIVFGHAMFEKALTPYLGMTTSTLLLHAPELIDADYPTIDAVLAEHWQQAEVYASIELKPLPILGVPDWFEGNCKESFYTNRSYFREKHRSRATR